jgi:hypothetical protein
VSKRRKRRRRQPPPRDQSVDGATLRRLAQEVTAEHVAHAERLVEQQERAAAALATAQKRIGKAIADLDQAGIAAVRQVVGPQNLSARFKAWRRRRLHRKRLAALDRALSHQAVRLADQSSAALLALVTERIARTSMLDDPSQDLAATIDVVQHVIDEYVTHASRLVHARDSARAETSRWRERTSTATIAGYPELASQADDRMRAWEQREREAVTALEAYEAGQLRLEDAVAQLRALAKRSARQAAK